MTRETRNTARATGRPGMHQGLVAVAMLALLSAAGPVAAPSRAAAQESPAPPYTVHASVDWASRKLSVEVSLDLAAAGLRMPSGRIEAERLIDRDLPGILAGLVLDLPVDSWRNVADCVDDGTLDESDLLGFGNEAVEKGSSFSRDMRSFVARYELPLRAVTGIFVRHRTAVSPAAPLEWRATRTYTGIVIHANAGLAVHGERVTDLARPCLFPRVYDDAMKLLLEKNGVDPEAIEAWGEVGYVKADALRDSSLLARLGESPLRIDATALFGTDRTDLIIPADEAMKILASPENRALLAAGKVVIVIDGDYLVQELGPAAVEASTEARD
jgi:hypothetical protein